MFQVLQRQSPVLFKFSLSISLYIGIGVAQLSDENVEEDDENEEKKQHVDYYTKPTGGERVEKGTKREKDRKNRGKEGDYQWMCEKQRWVEA